MANWYGQSRSNYFKVKNASAFKAWANALHRQVWSDGDELFALADNSEGFWPHERWDEEAEEGIDCDFGVELQGHLADGEVAILMTTGAEKLRYLTGYAVALNADGRRLDVNLDNIYDKVRAEFGVHPTQVSY